MAIKKYRKTAQLYNKNGTDTSNGFVNRAYLNTTGEVGDSANHTISEYIDISAFSQITLSGVGATSASITNAFYNENHEKVSYFVTDVVPKTVNVPSNAKYIRLTVANTRKDTLMLNGGSTALDYEAYGIVPIDWFYRKYETATDTYTSLPQTIIGDGTALSAWSMKGNMSQSGTPTPSNPVYPTEVGEKTANLSPNNTFTNTTTDTRSYLSLALQAYSDSGFLNQNLTNVTENKKAIVTLTAASGTTRLTVVHNGATQNIRIVPYFSAEAGKYTLVADVTGYNPTVEGGIVLSNIMILSGEYTLETIPPYEPTGYKIPILSNGVTYPVYLAEPIRKISTYADECPSTGTASRNVIKQVFTGQENWDIYSAGTDVSFFYLVLASAITGRNSLIICTHFERKAVDTVSNVVGIDLVSSGTIIRLRPPNVATDFSTTAAWKQYLADQYAAGTPVTVWYVLATATTETFTAPTIPTTGTAESFDVSTTLKPSEVSLTYHGWHEHSDTKYTTP